MSVMFPTGRQWRAWLMPSSRILETSTLLSITPASPRPPHSRSSTWVFSIVSFTSIFLPKLQAHGKGHIVNMSSMLGFIGVPNQSAYVATKFAIRGFTESLWAELYNTDIAVTGIYPGTIQSEILQRASFSDDREKEAMMKMMDRFGIPASDVAKKTVEAIKRRRREVIIGKDAKALVEFKRLFPEACHRLTASGAQKAKEKIYAGKWW